MAVEVRQVGGNAWAVGVSTNASAIIVPAVTGKRIRIISCFLMSLTAVQMNLNNGSGGSDLIIGQTGANGGFTLPPSDRGWGQTDLSTGVYLTLSSGVLTTGVIVFEYV